MASGNTTSWIQLFQRRAGRTGHLSQHIADPCPDCSNRLRIHISHQLHHNSSHPNNIGGIQHQRVSFRFGLSRT